MAVGTRTRLLVLGLMAAATAAAICLPQRLRVESRQASPITLTALMEQGIWTDEPVTAANAWRRDFRDARPILRRGSAARIRLRSADVVHSFSVPELGVDRVEVYPGRDAEITITPLRPGRFSYFCTTVCGPGHFAMRGELRVVEPGQLLREAPPSSRSRYWREPPPAPGAGPLALGAWRFRANGCISCHGDSGRGGVLNPNAMNAQVPDLATIARRMFLFTPQDAAAFRVVLTSGWHLEHVAETPTVPLFKNVKAQYLLYRQLVQEGRRSVRLDPGGPRPPLDMPAWRTRLADAEIDDILAYLLSLSEQDSGASGPSPHSLIQKEN